MPVPRTCVENQFLKKEDFLPLREIDDFPPRFDVVARKMPQSGLETGKKRPQPKLRSW
jgi:hypothetical protein